MVIMIRLIFWNKEQYMVFIDCLRPSTLSIMKLSGKQCSCMDALPNSPSSS